MSVTGLGRIATAEKMSVDQLREALQNKTLPAYIAVPLIEEKMDMNSRMQSMMAMRQAQQPRPPIAEQIMQRAATQGGIDALPTNLAPTQGMAGGGIVAFDDGGYVEPIRFQNTGLVPKTQEEIDREAMMDTIRRMKAAGMDILTLPGRGIAGAAESAITRPLRALGVPVPYLPRSFYGGDASSMTPYYDKIRKEDAERAAAQPPAAAKPDATIPPTAVAPPSAPGTAVPAAPGTSAPRQDRGIVDVPTKLPPPPTSSAMDVTRQFVEGEPNKATGERMGGYFQRSEDREKRLMEALGKDRLQGQAFGEYEKALKKEGEQAGLDKDQAKYMSLLKAGLAMMSGTSRHALENIGKGAMIGAADYQEAYKDLRKAERERTKEFALIEQARRAEARDDLKRRDDLLMRASDAAQKRDDFGTQAMLNAGIEDSRAARDIWKTHYSGAVQMRGQDITLQAARERASALASRGAGLTPAQLGRFRENAIKDVGTLDMFRNAFAKQQNLSKVPPPGADKEFDRRVREAYEKAINDRVRFVLEGASGGGLPQGFTLIPPGTED